MKVLVLDNVSEKAVKILAEGGIEAVVNNNKMTEAELCEIIGDYDGVIVRSATKITGPVIEAGKNLKIIGRAGVGVDNIDIPAATNAGLLVVNAPDGNTIAATEQTLALMLGLARNLPQAHKDLKDGKWMRKEYVGVELRNKVLGIIGLGRIGTAVAKRAQAFGMITVGCDPFVTPEVAEANGIIFKPMADVIKEADFLTLHIPKTKDSVNLINKDSIATMKDGARIINVARGGIINEEDLYVAVKEGKIAGAALDVFVAEPTVESPLFELNNVIVAPHLGASTEEAQVNVALDVAEEFVNVLVKGEMAKNAVNLPSIPADIMATVKPYLGLVEKLGKFAAQLTCDINTVEITYCGEVAELNTAPLTTTALKGVLSVSTEDAVNFVNAGILAKERGIKIIETKMDEAEDYAHLITVKVTGKTCKKSVSGMLFHNHDARIVGIDGYRIDALPAGYMLVVPHIDKPKVVGRVGTLLGEYDVNIASMQVGRKEIGGRAVMVLGVDAQVPERAFAELVEIDGVMDVKMVVL